ncbi:YlbF family regulator [Lapidilactobacillus luobeiensis]|uniref:YlbF family regulator n=1 Tax=Lapidilactobacillus luobeiensis TaxID=2950371 RepID=UPI0021C3D8A3|nr:YlbF family regulator [Lapidilactobacillus luobeiensis]
MTNIYDNANEMATVLRQTPQYAALQAAFGKMKADPIAYGLFQQMQKLQSELQQQQMANQEIGDEDIKKMQDFSAKLMKIDVVTELMNQEREMNGLMDELNQIVSKPITDLYRD